VTANVEDRPVLTAALIDEFEHATRPCRIEFLADRLGATHDPRAIRPLLGRLSDRRVQEYGEVEDAVCGALVSLDVMCAAGNLSFAFRPRHLLPPEVVEAVRELGPAIPMRYFLARSA